MEDFDISFDYTPVTEEEAMRARYSLLQEGVYDAVIERTFAKRSNSGNPMAEVKLSVFTKSGEAVSLRDYLVFTSKMLWKIKHAADSAGLTKEFEEKKFKPHMLEGKNVKVDIKIQKGQEIPADKLDGRPKGACYPDKNSVNDYVTTLIKTENKAKTDNGVDPELNDDIPF